MVNGLTFNGFSEVNLALRDLFYKLTILGKVLIILMVVQIILSDFPVL